MAPIDLWVSPKTGQATKRHGQGMRYRVAVPGQPTKAFPNNKKGVAEAYEIDLKAKLQQGLPIVDEAKGRVLFETYARQWLADHPCSSERSRGTLTSRLEFHLIPFFGQRRMCDIGRSTVQAWLAEMGRKKGHNTHVPLAEATIEACWIMVTSIMKAAGVDGVKPVNPCVGVTRPKPGKRRQIEVWEPEVVQQLLDALPDQHDAVGILAAWCGHRIGEAFAVAVGDVAWLKNTITVAHQVEWVGGQARLIPPKNDSVRTVPLGPLVKEALATHVQRYPSTLTMRCTCCGRGGKEHTLLFQHGARPLEQRQWNKTVWHPALLAAGMTADGTTGLHKLRHFFASTMIAGGVDVLALQKYMGHKDIKETMGTYGHLFTDTVTRDAEIVNNAMNAAAAKAAAAKQKEATGG